MCISSLVPRPEEEEEEEKGPGFRRLRMCLIISAHVDQWEGANDALKVTRQLYDVTIHRFKPA